MKSASLRLIPSFLATLTPDLGNLMGLTRESLSAHASRINWVESVEPSLTMKILLTAID
jgi:hypothetical protein